MLFRSCSRDEPAGRAGAAGQARTHQRGFAGSAEAGAAAPRPGGRPQECGVAVLTLTFSCCLAPGSRGQRGGAGSPGQGTQPGRGPGAGWGPEPCRGAQTSHPRPGSFRLARAAPSPCPGGCALPPHPQGAFTGWPGKGRCFSGPGGQLDIVVLAELGQSSEAEGGGHCGPVVAWLSGAPLPATRSEPGIWL